MQQGAQPEPLAGAPEPALRDCNVGLIWLVVQAMRRTPPLMPRSETQGRLPVGEIMDRGNGKGLPGYLREITGSEPLNHKALMMRVAVLAPDDDTAPLKTGATCITR